MELYAKHISDRVKSLSEVEKEWRIPKENYHALENCSLQLEELYEKRYERLILQQKQISSFLQGDTYFCNVFQRETEFLHTSLWAIDHFHCGVSGFDYVFWELATGCLLLGVDNSLIEHFFDPDTNVFNPELNPLPPIEFNYLDSAGNLYSTKDENLDRANPNSTHWNFYNGLRSPRAEQRERFQALYEELEYDDFDFLDDDIEIGKNKILSWDDHANDTILASLEEVKGKAGRPSNSTTDDRYAVMYAKVLMTRYFGDDRGKIPSRRSCISNVAKFLNIPKHNQEAFHKRIDRKLKRKMTMRNLG